MFFMVFMWVSVLVFLEFLVLCCIFLRCFYKEKISRRKIIRDIVKGMIVNRVLMNKVRVESCIKLFILEVSVMFILCLLI